MSLVNHSHFTRPFLKWAGNKYHCLHHILNVLPKANRLIEPFAGSGAVFLNADFKNFIIAEDNLDLIALYQQLQTHGESFIALCESYFLQENNQPERYYHLRDTFNQSVNPDERAALFLYLNRHGYNGLCRYNHSGKFNVPFGTYIKPYFPKDRMLAFYQKAQRAQFIHGDFQETFNLAKNGDVIYCDPPYVPLEQFSNFTAYTKTAFGEKEQITLAKLARNASKRGITVILSNHDTPFTRFHYQESKIISFKVPRFISRNANERKPVQELLAIFSCI